MSTTTASFMTQELTELQETLIGKKLAALFTDFPVQAIHLLAKDGTQWKLGEFPSHSGEVAQEVQEKKRRTRNTFPGWRRGEIRDVVKPWVELAMANIGEGIVLRPSDFPGYAIQRMRKALSTVGIRYCGNGNFTVRTEQDLLEGVRVTIMCKGIEEGRPSPPVAAKVDPVAGVPDGANGKLADSVQQLQDKWRGTAPQYLFNQQR